MQSVSAFIYYFSFREAKKKTETLAKSSGSRQTCSMQAADPVEVEVKNTTDDHHFPEPRLPYPFTSCLTAEEQKMYLYLTTKYSKKVNHCQADAVSERELLMYLVSVHIWKELYFLLLLPRVEENVSKCF